MLILALVLMYEVQVLVLEGQFLVPVLIFGVQSLLTSLPSEYCTNSYAL